MALAGRGSSAAGTETAACTSGSIAISADAFAARGSPTTAAYAFSISCSREIVASSEASETSSAIQRGPAACARVAIPSAMAAAEKGISFFGCPLVGSISDTDVLGINVCRAAMTSSSAVSDVGAGAAPAAVAGISEESTSKLTGRDGSEPCETTSGREVSAVGAATVSSAGSSATGAASDCASRAIASSPLL